ncbi:substrate-binding periplasmic protein [Silvanigrella aquatica]|uniref:Solute-binding protein family 3/N-terminal domain-containing protein n=1 Tax=Silvanigrella aquatica TaxID=1915309 RepID=A0A1L4D061_9BACT|nr:transporter substrate-binding domain-containing protein [Silvanigrella aquatica]APJ03578.1 hypothetical protein AXG55_06510 [Silvanigrella aquatica]
MKNFLIIVCIFMNSVTLPCFAEVITGYTEELPGLVEIDGDNFKGTAIDKVKKIFKKANLKEEIQITPWARSYEMVKRKKNHFIFPMAKNAEREKHFKFVTVLFKVDTYVYQRNNTEFKIYNLNDLKNLSICVVRNDVRDQYLSERQFSKLVRYPDQESAMKGLITSDCDAALMAENIEFLWKKHLHEDIKGVVKKSYLVKEINGDRYLSFNKDTDPEIIERVSKAAKDLKIN